MNNSMNNNINKSSSPTQQPTAMSSSNNSTPPPSTQQHLTLKDDRVIQSLREINDNAPTFNTSNNNNSTTDNHFVSLQRREGDNNNMDEGGNNNNRVTTKTTNTVRRRTSVLEAASTLASFSTTAAALPPSSTSPSFEQQTNNTSINNKVNRRAPNSATIPYSTRPSALVSTLTHNYNNNNNNQSLLAQQHQGRVEEGEWDNEEDYEQIGKTRIKILDVNAPSQHPHTVTGVYGHRNSLLDNLASRGSGNNSSSYEELRNGQSSSHDGLYEHLSNNHTNNNNNNNNKDSGSNKQLLLGEYGNNYNHRGELMNNYGGGNNSLMEGVGIGINEQRDGGARDNNGQVRRDMLAGINIRPPPSLNMDVNHQQQQQSGIGGLGSNMERDENKKEEEEMNDNEDNNNNINAPPGNDVPLTFPQKLMEVLSHPAVNDTIAWLPHGRGFIILQKRKFSLDVMPNYFKHSKFTSFTRKLNRWGFTRVSRGPEMGAYYHKLFQRGNYYMCTQMTCNSSNKSAATMKKEGEAADGTTTKKKKKSGPTAQSRVYAPFARPPPKAPAPMIELLDDEDMRSGNMNGHRSSTGDSDDSHMTSTQRMTTSLPFAGNHQSMNDRGGDLLSASRNDFGTRQQELDMLHRHMSNQRSTTSSGFDRAFSRHQAAMNQHQSTNPLFSVSNLNRRSPPMMQQSTGMSQSSSSSMQNRLRELEMMQHQLRQANQSRSNNESMSAKLLNLSANSSSSHHHPEVIAHAMNALKARNNQALLASLMTTNEHTKAADDKDMMVPQGYAAAMQTQPPLHRQFQEYNNNQDDRSMSLPSSAINYHRGDNSSIQGKDYATLLNQMKQIERLSQQTRPSSDSMSSRMISGAASNGSREIKISSLINQMSQSEVANLYREISARQQLRRQQQQQQSSSSGGGETLTGGETSQSSTEHASRGEYSRSVRRASAA